MSYRRPLSSSLFVVLSALLVLTTAFAFMQSGQIHVEFAFGALLAGAAAAALNLLGRIAWRMDQVGEEAVAARAKRLEAEAAAQLEAAADRVRDEVRDAAKKAVEAAR